MRDGISAWRGPGGYRTNQGGRNRGFCREMAPAAEAAGAQQGQVILLGRKIHSNCLASRFRKQEGVLCPQLPGGEIVFLLGGQGIDRDTHGGQFEPRNFPIDR